jgi:hypothetical protein
MQPPPSIIHVKTRPTEPPQQTGSCAYATCRPRSISTCSIVLVRSLITSIGEEWTNSDIHIQLSPFAPCCRQQQGLVPGALPRRTPNPWRQAKRHLKSVTGLRIIPRDRSREGRMRRSAHGTHMIQLQAHANRIQHSSRVQAAAEQSHTGGVETSPHLLGSPCCAFTSGVA